MLAHRNPAVPSSDKRDGSVIFNMCTVPGRAHLVTIRVDTLLLKVVVRRKFGVGERGNDEAKIVVRIRELGVSVVAPHDFSIDLEAMAQLRGVPDGPDFEEGAHRGGGERAGNDRDPLRGVPPSPSRCTVRARRAPSSGDQGGGDRGGLPMRWMRWTLGSDRIDSCR